jgi:hypothetical protein
MAESGTDRWKAVPDEDDPRKLVLAWDPSANDDLDELFARVRDRTSSKEDHAFFDFSMLDRFISRVYRGEQVEPWILEWMADTFYKVLMGGAWDEEIISPGKTDLPPKEKRYQRDLAIYCDARNLANDEHIAITDALQVVSEWHSVSYETARAAYYRFKKQLGDRVSKKAEEP